MTLYEQALALLQAARAQDRSDFFIAQATLLLMDRHFHLSLNGWFDDDDIMQEALEDETQRLELRQFLRQTLDTA